jgi:hypothetical protein
MKIKKYLEIIFIIQALFFILSCNSVNSPNDQIITPIDTADNDNYSIIFNKNTLDINDTLKIKIHPAKKSLTNGTIDFGDGSIINFSNLIEGVDTIFIHSYLNFGTYNVIIKFDIENGSLEWKYKVDIIFNSDYSIILNKETLDINDTLQIKIHLAKKSLTNGTIDFGDGSIINLMNLNEGLDTTFTHSYLNLGTFYVVIKFNIKNGILEQTYKVDIKHFFSLKFPIGMKWVYQYYLSDINYMLNQFNYTKGIHTWEVVSYSDELSEYTIRLSRIDTVYIGTHDSGNTTINASDQNFTIRDLGDTLKYNMPVGYLFALRAIPNNQYLTKYPLTLELSWSYIVCEDKIGISFYTYNPQISRYVQEYERLTLINYTTN